MTKDTTFKEFVEERGIRFARLVYGSEEYRKLAERFNEAKLQLARDENPPRRGQTDEEVSSGIEE